MDEQELIHLALDGDLTAFNRLVLEFQDMAYNVAYRIMGESDMAEDATQEAFISMYQKLNSFRGGSFKSWILRIVTNACYDELRRQKRKPVTALEPELEDGELMESPKWMVDDSPMPDEALDKSEMDEAIQHCLEGLDEKFRLVAVMIDIAGEDYETVSTLIQRPLGTVKSRLARARQKLQDCLQGFWELLPAGFRQTNEDVS
ncbi:MAG: sigma-70 family RNA polymerase sigma factor [Anaerolineaceae bacterium]|nr:sigma-70 family RNA polymerase sigma factor [Anaerolineaceae bacterium]